MFGIKGNISDGMLYLLNDMIEQKIISLKHTLENPDSHKNIEEIQASIEYYEAEMELFKEKVDGQLANNFQFSVEELYSMYGQYENKYIIIDFHKYSVSATNFGRRISGNLVYLKDERHELEAKIGSDSTPRTNGRVKIDAQSETLNDAQKTELLRNGFLSGDVYEIFASNSYPIKTFNLPGQKAIPGLMEIEVDLSDFDTKKMLMLYYSKRVMASGGLCDNEWNEFCGLLLAYMPSSRETEFMKARIYETDLTVKNGVRFYELEARTHMMKADFPELLEFDNMLQELRLKRTDSIIKELKRSTNKTFEQFEIDHPAIFTILSDSIYSFKEESLVYFGAVIPIYWTFESYLHIYLRHCNELNIEGHFEAKTKFQYSQSDIELILKLAIEQLLPEINQCMKDGRDFRNPANSALYFNGNHYTLHIDKTGRVIAFNPWENPNPEKS